MAARGSTGRRKGRTIQVLIPDLERLVAHLALANGIENLATKLGVNRSTLYRIIDRKVTSTPLLRSWYQRLGIEVRLVNRYDDDIEEVLAAYKKLRAASRPAAASWHRQIVEAAKKADAFEHQRDLLREMEADLVPTASTPTDDGPAEDDPTVETETEPKLGR